MAQQVYLVHATGDMGKDHYYYLYDSEEKAEKAVSFLEGDGERDYAPSEEEDPDWDYDAAYEEAVDENRLESFDSISEMNAYLRANNMDIACEYEAIMV